MSTAIRTGFDERRVRAARRFGVIGVVMTTFYLVSPVVSLFWNPLPTRPFLIPMGLLFVAAVGLHLWRIRQLASSLGNPAPTWFVVAAAVVGLSITCLGMASSVFGFTWGIVGGVLLGDVIGGRPWRVAAAWIAGAGVTSFGGNLLAFAWLMDHVGSPWLPAYWIFVACSTTFVLSMWALDVERLWWLKAVTDLDESRRTAAELATARERLRLADDLHDILGHALEVVAFKSELAARLQTVDTARARAELEQVQQVARESLSEVRALVRETRTTDLVSELAGARAVLESSGIVLVVRGDPEATDPTSRNVLGRVLREAMTNVLRHAQPSHCTIEIDVTDGNVTLTVINDGALPADGDDTGTGLAGLRRYLGEHAGHLDAGTASDGTFRLAATMPARV